MTSLTNEVQPTTETICLGSPRRSTVGCAEVLNTTRRTWLRLVGRRHDVQLWDVDTRVPTLAYKRPYTGRETGEEAWVTDVLERIRSRYVSVLSLQTLLTMSDRHQFLFLPHYVGVDSMGLKLELSRM